MPRADAVPGLGPGEVEGLVTTVVTSYNKAPWLREAIDSALAQGYPRQEVLVVDDGSTDATRAIAESYGDRVRYIHQENAGCPASKNTGVREGRGEFVAFLDGDDRWRPGKLAPQVEQLRADPGLGLSYTDRTKFRDEDGAVVHASNWGYHTPRRGWVLDHLLIDNFIPVSSVVARRACVLAAGMLNAEQRVASDFDLWLRMADRYRVDYVDEVLLDYRLCEGAIGTVLKNKFDHVMAIQERFLATSYPGGYPRAWVVSRATANRLASRGDYHLAHGRRREARADYREAARLDPSMKRLKRLARALVPEAMVGPAKRLLGRGGGRG